MPSLLDLPPNSRVFVDANILAYHFATVPSELQASVRNFLASIRPQHIQAFTSPIVTLEVVHRILVIEARKEYSLATSLETVNYLKHHPEAIKLLERKLPNIASELFNRFGIHIEAITHEHVHLSRQVRLQYGLLANDSMIVAMMNKLKLQHLVTNDRDFTKIPQLTVWLP